MPLDAEPLGPLQFHLLLVEHHGSGCCGPRIGVHSGRLGRPVAVEDVVDEHSHIVDVNIVVTAGHIAICCRGIVLLNIITQNHTDQQSHVVDVDIGITIHVATQIGAAGIGFPITSLRSGVIHIPILGSGLIDLTGCHDITLDKVFIVPIFISENIHSSHIISRTHGQACHKLSHLASLDIVVIYPHCIECRAIAHIQAVQLVHVGIKCFKRSATARVKAR